MNRLTPPRLNRAVPAGLNALQLCMAGAVGLLMALAQPLAHAQPLSTGGAPAVAPAGLSDAKPVERNIADWLMRMHEASRRRAYIGTFVVSSGNSMSSARIWHVCEGDNQMDRVQTLSGPARSTFRRNDEVMTFHSESKVALSEKRESMGLFPDLLKANDSGIAQFYGVRQAGVERVAGFDADVIYLQPKDNLRFGYRVWSEKKTGLVVKLQTLDTDGRVLEQAAFSELQLDAPVSMSKLTQMMGNVEGFKVEKQDLVKTTALNEGWLLKTPVAGFKPMSCFKRVVARGEGASADNAMQWIFSDGLASVSLFAEVFDRQRHAHEGLLASGATQSLTRRLVEKPDGKSGDKGVEWWLTVVGEVPLVTLTSFAQGLERKK